MKRRAKDEEKSDKECAPFARRPVERADEILFSARLYSAVMFQQRRLGYRFLRESDSHKRQKRNGELSRKLLRQSILQRAGVS